MIAVNIISVSFSVTIRARWASHLGFRLPSISAVLALDRFIYLILKRVSFIRQGDVLLLHTALLL